MSDLGKGIRLESGFYICRDDPIEFRKHETSGIKRQRLFAPATSIWIKNNNNDKSRLTRIHIVMLYN